MPIELVGMWPYWLDSADPSTVRNDITFDSMLLVTGQHHIVQRCWTFHSFCL